MTSEHPVPSRRPGRYGLMFALLILLILIEVMTVFAVLSSQRHATERALRDYSQELLKNVIDETRENALGYLRQAQDAVALGGNVFEAGLLAMDDAPRLERFFLEQLRVIPQLDGLYFGDQLGNFIFTRRGPTAAPAGFMTKLIEADAPEDQRVTEIIRDRFLNETSRERLPADAYDPRARPWYEKAVQQSGEIWTQPYVFFTSQQPGLTVARGIWQTDTPGIGVVGADIELSALSEFLKTQRIGSQGAAFIIDRNGNVIAHPHDVPLAISGDNASLRLKKMSEVDALTGIAGERLAERQPDLGRMVGAHYDKFESGGRRFISMFMPLLNHGDNHWLIGVYTAEDELIEKIREGQRESVFLGIAMSSVVITAAALIILVGFRPGSRAQHQAD